MKKLLSLSLCIIFVCLTLVGCAQDIIGEYLPNYNTDKVTDDEVVKLNFYIIGDNISDAAETTVPQNINAYLKEKYRIALNISYCTTENYKKNLDDALDNTVTDESKRPDIILINSKAMFDDLYANNRLAPLNNLYNSRDFRSINAIIDDSLLSASIVVENDNNVYYTVPNNHVVDNYEYIVIDKEMARDKLHFSSEEIGAMTNDASLKVLVDAIEAVEPGNSALYIQHKTGDFKDKILLEYGIDVSVAQKQNIVNIVPTKNSVSDIFEYVVINKQMAEETLHIDTAELKTLTNETSLAELKAKITEHFAGAAFNMEDYVKVVKGDYESKVILEYGVDTSAKKTNFVNINSYPTATKEEAFKSAFAIVKNLDDKVGITEDQRAVIDSHYADCMSIIYALNTDVELKNMLQYGYRGTNYKFVTDEKNENTNYIKLITDPGVAYQMNPIYTGNQFISYYCDDISWDETIYRNYLRQNADAKTSMQKLVTEANSLNVDLTEVKNGDKYMVTDFYGDVYSDVKIEWSANEYAVIDETTGEITFKNETDNLLANATVKATLSCVDEPDVKFEKTFSVKVFLTDAQKAEVAKNELELVYEDDVTSAKFIALPKTNAKFSDVTISWSENHDNAEIKFGILTFTNPTEDVEVIVTAEITCGEETVVKTFTILLKATAE